MAGRIPAMSGAKVVSLLKKHKFRVDRIEGSHHIMRHEDGRGTTVPVHNRDVAKGTMASILQDVGLTAEQLQNPKLVKDRTREMTPQEVAEGSAPAANAVRADAGTGRSGGRHGPVQTTKKKSERGRPR